MSRWLGPPDIQSTMQLLWFFRTSSAPARSDEKNCIAGIPRRRGREVSQEMTAAELGARSRRGEDHRFGSLGKGQIRLPVGGMTWECRESGYPDRVISESG